MTVLGLRGRLRQARYHSAALCIVVVWFAAPVLLFAVGAPDFI